MVLKRQLHSTPLASSEGYNFMNALSLGVWQWISALSWDHSWNCGQNTYEYLLHVAVRLPHNKEHGDWILRQVTHVP